MIRTSPQGYAAIPKSTHQNRIVENTGIFGWALSDDEMKELNALDECKSLDSKIFHLIAGGFSPCCINISRFQFRC
jgi:diketogulonate reductase-like aldo/keto reductase